MEETGEFGWRLKPFIYCYLAAAILCTTFFTATGETFWKPVDEAFFRLLNSTLASEGIWPFIVAWANTKIFDTLWAGVMGLLCLMVLFSPRFGTFSDRFARIFAITLTVIAGIALTKISFKHYDRISPSLVLDGFINLGELLPEINAKVGSLGSFPGDHGVASVLFVICFFSFFRTWPLLTAAALPIAIVNSLPRLIAGGHWLSDVVVGAGTIGLLVFPLLVGTPYLRFVQRATTPIATRILQPLFERMRFSKKNVR